MPAAVEAALSLEEVDLAPRRALPLYGALHGDLRGYNYATALETALKLKELTYYRHDALFLSRFPTRSDRRRARRLSRHHDRLSGPRVRLASRSSWRDMRQRRAEEILVTDDADLAEGATLPLVLPVSLPEWLSPIPAIIPGQLLGYYLAVARGLDPERPRGLAKGHRDTLGRIVVLSET